MVVGSMLWRNHRNINIYQSYVHVLLEWYTLIIHSFGRVPGIIPRASSEGSDTDKW